MLFDKTFLSFMLMSIKNNNSSNNGVYMLKSLTILIGLFFCVNIYASCIYKALEVSGARTYKRRGVDILYYTVSSYEIQYGIEPKPSQAHIIKKAYEENSLIDIHIALSCKHAFKKRIITNIHNSDVYSITPSETNRLDCSECDSITNPPLVYDFPAKEILVQFLVEKDILHSYPARQVVDDIFRVILEMNFKKETANSSLLPFILLKILAHNGIKSITGQNLQDLSTLLSSNFTALEISFMSKIFLIIKKLSLRIDGDDLFVTLSTKNRKDIKIEAKDLPLVKGSDLMNKAEIFFNHLTLNHGMTLKFKDIQNIRNDGDFNVRINGASLVAGFSLVHLKAKRIEIDIKSQVPLRMHYTINFFPMTQEMDF